MKDNFQRAFNKSMNNLFPPNSQSNTPNVRVNGSPSFPAVAPQPVNNSGENMQTRFIREALDAHNRCRARHGCQSLTHNPELSNIAQNYANYLARINQMRHSNNQYKGQRIGENLSWRYDPKLNYYPGMKLHRCTLKNKPWKRLHFITIICK